MMSVRARGLARAPRLASLCRIRGLATEAQRKPRVLVLGSGWGGNKVARELDKSKFDVRLASPANHFLFTPMLPGTAVGTLEFRAIQEPVRTISGLSEYYQAKARSLDTSNRTVQLEDIFKGASFDVAYDYLILAVGNKTHTFNTPGVAEREGKEVFFLKHLHHARQIRNRILECFERASNPTLSADERARLLSFVVVGGGATSCEFTTELADFLKQDVARWFPELRPTITLVEAGDRILGPFDEALATFYASGLRKRGVDVRTSTAVRSVECVDDANGGECVLGDGTVLPMGAMVWSAGLQQVKFVTQGCEALPRDERSGRLRTDEFLRVAGTGGRGFAIGDCADIDGVPLPPTAMVAEQQGAYLAKCFNEYYSDYISVASDVLGDVAGDMELPKPGPVRPAAAPFAALWFVDYAFAKVPHFRYVERGAMASMGMGGGILDLGKAQQGAPGITGVAAAAVWKGAYWTKQLSWANMMLIPMYWFKTLMFGRDISRF